MRIRATILASLIFTMVGCVTFTPPKHHSFSNSQTFDASMNDVWAVTVEFIAKNKNFRIDTIERDSGVMSATNLTSHHNPVFLRYADCGKWSKHIPSRNKLNYTVFAKEKSAKKTELTINAEYSMDWWFDGNNKWTACVSKGTLEKQLFDWINANVLVPTADH